MSEGKQWFDEKMRILNARLNASLTDDDYKMAESIISELVSPILKGKLVKEKNRNFSKAKYNVQQLVVNEMNKLGVSFDYDFISDEFEYTIVPIDETQE